MLLNIEICDTGVALTETVLQNEFVPLLPVSPKHSHYELVT